MPGDDDLPLPRPLPPDRYVGELIWSGNVVRPSLGEGVPRDPVEMGLCSRTRCGARWSETVPDPSRAAGTLTGG